ncbi:MAG TPA: DnaJ domain-containing protein [Polyangiaceae bacterium]|nr:DnaJ domain-containing protein [Polyangiaceae bacterium]
MVSRNYYLVLGVASNESGEGIRSAYRDLAKQLHPDHVGPAGAAAFREITEAYDVLRDPSRRRDYDDSLRTHRTERRVSVRRDLAEVRPSEEALSCRFARNFTGIGVPKGERVEALDVEIAISKEEAERGTRVCLGVPVFAPCGACRGRGCDDCGWQGGTEGERPVAIDLPPMTGRGTTFVMPLKGLGIHNFYVRVRVRVDQTVEPTPRATRTDVQLRPLR